MNAHFDAPCNADAVYINRDGLTTIEIPEAAVNNVVECSNSGVSTINVPTQSNFLRHEKHKLKAEITVCEKWYVLRTTYGREKKAYDFIIKHGGNAFLPTIKVLKNINGNKKIVEVSRIPNIFFAYGSEEYIKTFVFDNFNLPFLRFYYKRTLIGSRIVRTPLIVPESQITSLRIICESDENNDILLVKEEVLKFRQGEKVRVIDGYFKGVEGVVARYHGQQRVGIVIDGLLTAITAYVPSAFLEKCRQ